MQFPEHINRPYPGCRCHLNTVTVGRNMDFMLGPLHSIHPDLFYLLLRLAQRRAGSWLSSLETQTRAPISHSHSIYGQLALVLCHCSLRPPVYLCVPCCLTFSFPPSSDELIVALPDPQPPSRSLLPSQGQGIFLQSIFHRAPPCSFLPALTAARGKYTSQHACPRRLTHSHAAYPSCI